MVNRFPRCLDSLLDSLLLSSLDSLPIILKMIVCSPFSSLVAGNAEKISCDKPLRINRKEEK
jgi:hypothetical protein